MSDKQQQPNADSVHLAQASGGETVPGGAARMNPEVKARWVAALRSGEYKQSSGTLKNKFGHCCLGVLCDLYAKEHGIDEWTGDGSLSAAEESLPSDTVVEWAGLPSANPPLLVGEARHKVARHNDGENTPQKTFAQIADAIEQQL